MARADEVGRVLAVLAGEKRLARLEAALNVLAASDDPRVRGALTAKYLELEEQGDPGAVLRGAIVGALRARATLDEVALLERAVRTYERVPPRDVEVGHGLRAMALLALNEVDPELASFHAVRLLFEAVAVSGEPAVTAATVLGRLGQRLPLYHYLVTIDPTAAPDVSGECLRGLAGSPPTVLREVADRCHGCEDEIVLLGLFDLLLPRDDFNDYILGFLGETRLDGVFEWLVTTIVASRRQDLIAGLQRLRESDSDRTRRNMLRDALSLL